MAHSGHERFPLRAQGRIEVITGCLHHTRQMNTTLESSRSCRLALVPPETPTISIVLPAMALPMHNPALIMVEPISLARMAS